MISQELLTDLKDILKTDFGLNLTLDEVAKIAADLVGYFDLLAEISFEKRGGEIYGNKKEPNTNVIY